MDLTTALKPDIYRVVAVVMVPGFVAGAPWVAGVFWPSLQDSSTWEHASLPISITAFGIVLVLGLVLENAGSRIESLIDGLRKSRTHPSIYATWEKYLAIPATQERIGSGYLRAILLRYKFELSMIPATIGALAGLWVSQACGHGLGAIKSLVLCIALFLSTIWFSFEAYGSAGVLQLYRGTRPVLACDAGLHRSPRHSNLL
ncbi:hypothetical protein [Rhodanobacter sp. MP7CTX1]|uniref:hypothetical protein n=1 Tax=Rhodanobacter sp. MP7CTX1 TaxID=2723084 RepID=UPI00161E46D8|nr:hypothetical protein [Rhodanobacter sp. MP7CTX1]MBB6188109.1 hypothetical protein [Rhodanobacter sp. MP7CTX1]